MPDFYYSARDILDKAIGTDAYCQIKSILTGMKAADVAPVVRCKDCKHRIYKDMGFDIGEVGGCQIWGVALPGDFYCAHGAHIDKEKL